MKSREPKTGGNAPSDGEQLLFREAMRGVTPLQNPPPLRAVPKPRPRARFRRLDDPAVLIESLHPNPADRFLESGEEAAFKREGVPERILTKLKRGEYRLEAQIDLHGLNAIEAKQALREFLQEARQARLRCVRVIHGKGRGSGMRGPVLKITAQGLLQRIDAVLAYCSARPIDGGTGALYVLLQ